METVNGGITGTRLVRISDVRSISGGIDLTGDVATAAQIVTVSGGVSLRLSPAASVHLDASSASGDISTDDVALSMRQVGSHTLSGKVGAGANAVSVRTTNGSINLHRGS